MYNERHLYLLPLTISEHCDRLIEHWEEGKDILIGFQTRPLDLGYHAFRLLVSDVPRNRIAHDHDVSSDEYSPALPPLGRESGMMIFLKGPFSIERLNGLVALVKYLFFRENWRHFSCVEARFADNTTF
jgi:hypothetical protein